MNVPPRFLVSVRRYFPAGDRRLSHWHLVECDLHGRTLVRWTDGPMDHLGFDFDTERRRVFCLATSRRDRHRPWEVRRYDRPGGRPTVLARLPEGEFADGLSLSPDRRHIAVLGGWPDTFRILDTESGRQRASGKDAVSFRWIGVDTYETESSASRTRIGRLGGLRPAPGAADTSRAPFEIETEYPDDDGIAVHHVVDAAGNRTRLTGDPLWNRCLAENIIQGLELGEARPDGTWWIQTYPHRASSQVVGILDPARAAVRFAFRSPGEHLIVEDTPWVLGWAMQRFTPLGDILVEERPLHLLDRRHPGLWKRVWRNPHHVEQVTRIA